MGGERTIVEGKIAESPIVRVDYLKYKFPEIDFEEMIEKLEIERELPISSNCIESARNLAETRLARDIKGTSHELKQIYNEMQRPEQENQKED